LRAELPGAEVTVRSARLRAVSTPAEHPLVQRALALAGRTAASGSNTLSDMALLQGVPAIKCGPGQSLRSHKPDEFVTADELARGAAFYDALLEAWLAQPAAMTP
jgi:acetylornithine deacetylase